MHPTRRADPFRRPRALVALAGMSMVLALAMTATADCFKNKDVNTCDRLPTPPAGECFCPTSSNNCIHHEPGGSGNLLSPTDATCRYKKATVVQGQPCSCNSAEYTATVQCQATSGSGCNSAPGEEES